MRVLRMRVLKVCLCVDVIVWSVDRPPAYRMSDVLINERHDTRDNVVSHSVGKERQAGPCCNGRAPVVFLCLFFRLYKI